MRARARLCVCVCVLARQSSTESRKIAVGDGRASRGWFLAYKERLGTQGPRPGRQKTYELRRTMALEMPLSVMDEERREQLQRRFIRQQRRLRWAERRAEVVTQRWKERNRRKRREDVRTVPHAACAAALRETMGPLRKRYPVAHVGSGGWRVRKRKERPVVGCLGKRKNVFDCTGAVPVAGSKHPPRPKPKGSGAGQWPANHDPRGPGQRAHGGGEPRHEI